MRNASLAAAIAMALQLPSAWAQETPNATLGEVIVTAQRRSENIQDVPVAVSTLSGEGLDVARSGGDDIRFLSARLPSLNIESSFGRAFPRFYIRGLGNTDFDLNASQPVSLVYDDVVQENPILKGFPVFDLEMVEMFRGPQGTLFGRNTPAGVIKFNSVRPSQESSGYVQASYGSQNSISVEGASAARSRTPGPCASRASIRSATTGSTTSSPARATSSRASTKWRDACSSCTTRAR